MTPTRRSATLQRLASAAWTVLTIISFIAYLVPGTGGHNDTTLAFGLGALALSVLYEILALVKESNPS